MKIERLLGILCLLASRDKITVQEIAKRFEVSRRTILRDLDTLSCAGIPIVAYPGSGGGVAIVEGYKVDRKVLSIEDTEKLFTALSALKSIDGDISITNLMAKLVPEAEMAVFSQSHYVIDLSSWFTDSIVHEKIARLHRAIGERCLVRFEYIAKNSRLVRTVEPHKLVFKQSTWYVYAFCRERQAFRLFKVSRIVSCEFLEEHFKPRSVEKIDFGNNYGIELFSPQDQAELFEIVLAYIVADEFYLTDRIDASFFVRPPDAPSGFGEIRFRVANLAWAADLVFSLLDKVQVVSPLALQTEIKRRLDIINSRNKGDI